MLHIVNSFRVQWYIDYVIVLVWPMTILFRVLTLDSATGLLVPMKDANGALLAACILKRMRDVHI